MLRLRLVALLLIVLIALPVRAAAALELRVDRVGMSASRVAATFELRDLLRDRFLDIVREGRSIFLQLQAELWEDRRMADRLTLTTPALTYRVFASPDRGVIVVSQFGDRTTHADLRAPLPVRVDLGPGSVVTDGASYYLRATVTAATVAERDIEQFSTAIFGDDQSAAGLAGLGRFVFANLLQIGKYLDSASARATSTRYTGAQIRAGP